MRSQSSGSYQDFSATVGSLLAQRIYWFSPERPNLATAPFGANNELASDARNLAEVLNKLQHNSGARCADYCNLLKDVFPSIRRDSVDRRLLLKTLSRS